jgi:hypothetical protein
VLKREAASEPVHRASEIEVFALDSRFLDELGTHLGRENRWSLIHDQGELVISIGEENVIGPITLHRLDSPR